MRRALFLVLFAMGCSSEDTVSSPATDSAVVDTAVIDSTTPDTANDVATDAADDSAPDTAAADATDGAPDVSAETAMEAAADAGCDWFPADEVIVRCGGTYKFVSRFEDSAMSASCPPFWSTDGTPPGYSTADAAIAAGGCDGTCQWHFASEVTRFYCGVKTGYEKLSADGCKDIYRFDDGWYDSVEAHDTAHPCP